MDLFKRGFLLLLFASFALFYNQRNWENEKLIDWDISNYYYYLPATFIYQNYNAPEFSDQIWEDAHFKLVSNQDQHYAKMTSGLSMLWSPFFLAAHQFAKQKNSFEANGFSEPYRYALLLSSLLYALAGLYCLGRFLLHFFNEQAATLAMLAIFLGSNMLYYSFVSPMSHVYSFTLVAFLMFQVKLYTLRQKTWRSIIIGIAAGLLILIRPTNIVALLFPALLLLFNRRSLKTPKLIRNIGISVVTAILVGLPQLLYWHHMTGNWIVYSYNEEGFFLLDPEIWKGLFSYRKGWYLYAPILFVATLGFLPLFRRQPRLAIAVTLTMLPAFWITYSWWCWWYGGSFGSRPMIEYLPFMAIPLAAIIQYISTQQRWLKWSAGVAIAFLCFWAAFMNWQYSEGLIHYDSMSKELYWEMQFKDHFIPNYSELMDPPDYEAALKNED